MAVAETSIVPFIVTLPVAAKYTGVLPALRLNFTSTPAGMLIVVWLKTPSGGRFSVTMPPGGFNGPSEPSETTIAANDADGTAYTASIAMRLAKCFRLTIDFMAVCLLLVPSDVSQIHAPPTESLLLGQAGVSSAD